MIHTPNRPPCPSCWSSHVVKNGKGTKHQLYKCRACGRQFRSTGAVDGLCFPPELVGEAIAKYFQGLSLERVVEELARDWVHAPFSRNTVSRWVKTYTAIAAKALLDSEAAPVQFWLVVTLPTRVGRQGCWAWFVADATSPYLLACHISIHKDVDATGEVLSKARRRAADMPALIAFDADGPCGEVVTGGFPDALPVHPSDPAVDWLPEPLAEGLRAQASRIHRMQDLESALRYLEGWALFHNHLGGSVTPDGRTPGAIAGARVTHATWADVVRLGPPERIARP